MKRIYISGPISGYHDLNRPKFTQAARWLADVQLTPVNPFDLIEPAPHLAWGDYMKADLAALLTCDGVATLPGWQESRGACIEVRLAQDLGIPVMGLLRWLERPA